MTGCACLSATGHFLNDDYWPETKRNALITTVNGLWSALTWAAYNVYRAAHKKCKDNYMQVAEKRYKYCDTVAGVNKMLQDLKKIEPLKSVCGKYGSDCVFRAIPNDSLGMGTVNGGQVPVLSVICQCKSKLYADICVFIYDDRDCLRAYVPTRGNAVFADGEHRLARLSNGVIAQTQEEVMEKRATLKCLVKKGYAAYWFGRKPEGGGIYWPGVWQEAQKAFVGCKREYDCAEKEYEPPASWWERLCEWFWRFLFGEL